MTSQPLYKNTLFLNSLLAFLYFFTGKLSSLIFVTEKTITFSLFPPEGIALAFALYFGKKIIPGIFIGQVILGLINHLNLFQSVGIGVGNSLEALIAIYLWNKYKLSTTLENFKDFFYLIGMIIFILQPFSAVFGNIILSIGNKFSFLNLLYWWVGNILGQIIFTPFLLMLFNRFKPSILKNFLLNGAVFLTVIYIFVFILNIKSIFILLMVSSALIFYFLIKNGLVCGFYLNILLYYEILTAIMLRKNIFSTYSSFDNAVYFDLFLVYNTVLIYIIGVLFEKEKRHTKELKKTVEKVTNENKKHFEYILKQKNLLAKSEIINMLAHQWRQPLNNISLLSELIYTKYQMNNLSNEDVENFRNRINQAVTSLSDTIEEMNNLNAPIKKETFNIEEIINKLLSKSEEKLKEITLKTDMNDYNIIFNKEAFMQIFTAILNNAVEALKNKDQKEIKIKTTKENDSIILIIKDNAEGIKEPDKIFEPYYSTKSKNKRGLSLFIAKTLADKLDAKIEAKNNNGAVFKLTFKGGL